MKVSDKLTEILNNKLGISIKSKPKRTYVNGGWRLQGAWSWIATMEDGFKVGSVYTMGDIVKHVDSVSRHPFHGDPFAFDVELHIDKFNAT